jgi:hypothetical protein
MATDSPLSQLQAVYSAFCNFLKGLSGHLDTASTTAYPSRGSLEVEVSGAISSAVLSTDRGASSRVGALVEAVHMATALTREVEMSKLTRSQIYSAAASEASADADMYAAVSASETSLFSSNDGT